MKKICQIPVARKFAVPGGREKFPAARSNAGQGFATPGKERETNSETVIMITRNSLVFQWNFSDILVQSINFLLTLILKIPLTSFYSLKMMK